MNLLVRTPAPFLTESLYGYVLRLSEANGYESPYIILQMAQGHAKGRFNATLPAHELSNVVGHSLDSLERLAYSKKLNKCDRQILGHDLGGHSGSWLLRANPAVCCPACIQQYGFIDAYWDLKVSSACPVHRQAPLYHCSACQKPLSWHRLGLLVCRCGAPLSNESIPIENVSVIELLGIVMAKLHGHSLKDLPNESKFPIELLEPISLRSLLVMLVRLANYHHASLLGKNNSLQDTRLIEYASQVLAHWPNGYHQLLSRLGKIYQDRQPSIGFTQQFRPFYLNMFKINSWYGPELSFLHDEFVRFGLTSWNQAKVCDSLLKTLDEQPNSRFIFLKDYRKQFGISYNAMNQMIQDGAIVLRQAANEKGRKVIDLELSQRPLKSKGSMLERQAARFIGLPCAVLSILREWGVYRSVTYYSGYKSTWQRLDLEEFLAKCLQLHQGSLDQFSHSDANKKVVSLKWAMGLRRLKSETKATLVAAMIDGVVPVLGRTGKNLAGLLLDRSLVLEWIAKREASNGLRSYSQGEAARFTYLPKDSIDLAMQKGFLDGILHESRIRVLASSVDRFNIQYRTHARLSKDLSVRPNHLKKLCIEQRIPVISPVSDGLGKSGPWMISAQHEPLLQSAVMEEQTRLAQKLQEQKQYGEGIARFENRLSAYLQSLIRSGGRLPRHAGKINISAITRAVGFSKEPLLEYPSVYRILKEFEEEENNRYGAHSGGPVESVRLYIEQVRRGNQILSKNKKGKICKEAVAKACGFEVRTLFRRTEVLALLNAYEANTKFK